MNKEAFKQNALRGIEQQQASEDPSAGVILQCKRNIQLVDEVWPSISPEDKERMRNASTDMLECKGIKERYGVSWSELREMRVWEDEKRGIRFKVSIINALANAGYTAYRIRKENILAEGTMQKLRKNSTSISLDTLGKLCELLDMQPADLIEYS